MGKTSEVFVAFLRGVNVGGKNKLPMSGLAELMAGCGCSDVVTYIQSGNAVFRSSSSAARRLPTALPLAIEQRFGFASPVIVRRLDELEALARDNPFLADRPALALHVALLADEPDPRAVKALDPRRSPPDEYAVRGREIYLFCPNGVARTKLTTAYFDSKLSTTSTMRNWRTLDKLLALARGGS